MGGPMSTSRHVHCVKRDREQERVKTVLLPGQSKGTGERDRGIIDGNQSIFFCEIALLIFCSFTYK
jgi:hypothetical protein